MLEIATPLTIQLELGNGVILGEGKERGAIDGEFQMVEGVKCCDAGGWCGVSQEDEIYVVGVSVELDGEFNGEGVDEVLEDFLI